MLNQLGPVVMEANEVYEVLVLAESWGLMNPFQFILCVNLPSFIKHKMQVPSSSNWDPDHHIEDYFAIAALHYPLHYSGSSS